MSVVKKTLTCSTTAPNISAKAQSNYSELMSAATGTGSVYLTVLNFIESLTVGTTVGLDKFSKSERAKLIATIASSIVSSISNAALDIATEIAKFEQQLPYDVAEVMADMQYKQSVGDANIDEANKLEVEKSRVKFRSWEIQAELVRDYGASPGTLWANVTDETRLLLNGANSTKRLEVAMIDAETTAVLGRTTREYGRLESAQLNYHSASGAYYYTVTPHAKVSSNRADSLAAGLTANQTAATLRNVKAYEDNAAQHVANSASQLMGMMLENPIITTGASGESGGVWNVVSDHWKHSLAKLTTDFSR